MKKYNKSEIMKRAWKSYKAGQEWNGAHKNFAECLKDEWAIAKKDIEIAEETKKFFAEVCIDYVKNGEDEVYDAFRIWDDKAHNDSQEVRKNGSKEEIERDSFLYTAHIMAWKAAKAIFRDVRPTFSTELINTQIVAEIQSLEIA